MCPGDSGGPAIVGDRVVGISSWIYFNRSGVPFVSHFARVDSYSVRKFLETQTSELTPLEYNGGGS